MQLGSGVQLREPASGAIAAIAGRAGMSDAAHQELAHAAGHARSAVTSIDGHVSAVPHGHQLSNARTHAWNTHVAIWTAMDMEDSLGADAAVTAALRSATGGVRELFGVQGPHVDAIEPLDLLEEIGKRTKQKPSPENLAAARAIFQELAG